MGQRISTAIGYKGAQSIYYAAREVAEHIGYPLNTWVTINFEATAVSPFDCTARFSRFRTNYFNKWAKRPAIGAGAMFEPTYVYVFENARENEVFMTVGDGLPHNIHVHWYVHVPAKRRFEFDNKLWDWCAQIFNGPVPEGAIHVQSIHQDNGVAPYCLKGAQKHVAKRFGAEKRFEPQGMVVGKRSGVSLNIGPSARRRMDKVKGIDRRARFRRAA